MNDYREQIVRRLTEYLRRTTGETVAPDVLLLESGTLDSMAAVLFVAHVEEEFDIDIPMAHLMEGVLESVDRAALYLTTRAAPITPTTPTSAHD